MSVRVRPSPGPGHRRQSLTRLPNGRASVCPGNPPALSPTGPPAAAHVCSCRGPSSSSNIANRVDCYIPSDANYKAKWNSLILKALFKYGLSSFTLLVLPIQNPTRETLLEVGPRDTPPVSISISISQNSPY